jgi:hypothetical protein
MHAVLSPIHQVLVAAKDLPAELRQQIERVAPE